jgi:GAF domain-containing protein
VSALTVAAKRIIRRASADDIVRILDAPVQRLFAREVGAVGADEGSVWWADPERSALTIVLNSGPHRDRLVGTFSQPLSAGLISMVFATQQPFGESDVARNRTQDSTLDQKLGVRTEAMIAVPLVMNDLPVGVISCVQLQHTVRPAALTPFGPDAMHRMQDLSIVVGRLLHYGLSSPSSAAR